MPSSPRRLVPIPTSQTSPFDRARPELQYFIERTAGGAVTTLAASLNEAQKHLEIFEMGYTNLWIHRRVFLVAPQRPRRNFTALDSPRIRPNDRVGRFFIVGEDGSKVDWLPNDGSNPDPKQMVLGFADARAALFHLERLSPSCATLVTELVDDVYWH